MGNGDNFLSANYQLPTTHYQYKSKFELLAKYFLRKFPRLPKAIVS